MGLFARVKALWYALLNQSVTEREERLEQDVELFPSGRFDALPMGYLLCGVIGTGKTFTPPASPEASGSPRWCSRTCGASGWGARRETSRRCSRS